MVGGARSAARRSSAPEDLRLGVVSFDDRLASLAKVDQVALRDDVGAPCAYTSSDATAASVAVPGVGRFALKRDSREVRAFVSSDTSEFAIADAFYGTALPLLAQNSSDVEVLHASGVFSTTSTALLLCGPSGSGKSTVAAELSFRGWTRWADDASAWTLDGEQPVAVPLPLFDRSAEPPRVLRAAPSGARIRLILVLERADDLGEPSTAAYTPAEALSTLMANAFRFQPATEERKRQSYAHYLHLVKAVGVLRLRFPHDRKRLPDVLDCVETTLQQQND